MPAENSREQRLLAQRLLIAVVAPVGLLLLVGLLLAFQVVRLTDTAHWVDHTDEVIGRVSEIQTQIVDQETGIRGYLLSRRIARSSLQYELLRAAAADVRGRAQALVADNGPQQVRCDTTRARYEAWLAMSEPLLLPNVDLAQYRTVPEMLERKRRMDSIREAVQQMLLTEQTLRSERAAAYADSTRLNTILGLPLFLALAGGLAFLSRKQLTEVSNTYTSLLDGERAGACRKSRLKTGSALNT